MSKVIKMINCEICDTEFERHHQRVVCCSDDCKAVKLKQHRDKLNARRAKEFASPWKEMGLKSSASVMRCGEEKKKFFNELIS